MPSMVKRLREALIKKIKLQVQKKWSVDWLCKLGHKNIQKEYLKKSGIS